jgi:hypothetical protein
LLKKLFALKVPNRYKPDILYSPRHTQSLPTTVKLLILENPKHISFWRRKKGYWKCIESSGQFSWFRRINNIAVVSNYLHKQHIPFHWESESTTYGACSDDEKAGRRALDNRFDIVSSENEKKCNGSSDVKVNKVDGPMTINPCPAHLLERNGISSALNSCNIELQGPIPG